MAEEMKQFSILATLLTIVLIYSNLIPIVVCEPEIIPADSSKLDAWIGQNVKQFIETKSLDDKKGSVLDDVLATAEAGLKVITVKKDGSGDFKTVTDAVNSIPSGNTKRTVIKIGGGEYREKITIDKSKRFITFLGDPKGMPKILFDGTAAKYGTVNSATVAVESDYFVAVNIEFVVRLFFFLILDIVFYLYYFYSAALSPLLLIKVIGNHKFFVITRLTNIF